MTSNARGLSLVELMVVLAVIMILGAIAAPAYHSYIRESQISIAHVNANSLRVPLEDYFLENSSYVVGGDSVFDMAELETNFGWTPEGDKGNYTYVVTAVDAVAVTDRTWHVVIEHASTNMWVRCENRLSNCCDIDTPGATKDACP